MTLLQVKASSSLELRAALQEVSNQKGSNNFYLSVWSANFARPLITRAFELEQNLTATDKTKTGLGAQRKTLDDLQHRLLEE
eukprot:2173769-Alexandrium_andersonii.AAC.1